MIKFKSSIKKSTTIKSAICFFIFYIITMASLTFILAENNKKNLRSECNNNIIRMKNRLDEIMTYKTDTYRMCDLNTSMIQTLQEMNRNHVYVSYKVADENENVICNTRSVIGSGYQNNNKYIFIDKYISEKQMKQITQNLSDGNGFNFSYRGFINDYEIIPKEMQIKIDDKKQLDFDFHNNDLYNTEIITHSGYSYGIYESCGYKNYNQKILKRYNEVKSYTDNEIQSNLKLVLNMLSYSCIDKSTFTKVIIQNNFIISDYKDNETVYFVAYSYMFFPYEIAINQLIPLYIFSFIILLILISVLSINLTKWIVSPILSLNNTANRIANGETLVSYKIGNNRKDEIGQLSNSLDNMSNKLNISMKMLEDDIEYRKNAEQSRRDLTNAIAHELKTPLGIIRGYCEGLKENINEDKKDYYLDVIIDETAQIDKMVLEMLNLSKLEANAYTLKKEPISLKAITDNEIERYKKLFEEKNIKIDLMYQDDGKIDADKTGLTYVISNFISNAIKHTPFGLSIKIQVESDNGKINFTIENEGENIPDDKLIKIWDSFYKVDDSRERNDGGTGLGLSIAKNYLFLHQAQFGCENTENGVRFWFSIDKK